VLPVLSSFAAQNISLTHFLHDPSSADLGQALYRPYRRAALYMPSASHEMIRLMDPIPGLDSLQGAIFNFMIGNSINELAR
jgi:hypothetical protein